MVVARSKQIAEESDNSDEEDEEGDAENENGGSIWANAADMFNPAKRANFIQSRKPAPKTKLFVE